MNQDKISDLKREYSIENIHTVSSLNNNLYRRFQEEREFYSISILGEVSNLTITAKNYTFFDLKDETSKISCVIFDMDSDQRELIQDGKEILVQGKLEYYKSQGKTQIRPHKIMPVGEGIIALKLKILKNKLKNEGLFDGSRKKDLPRIPQKIGVITSQGRDAFKDIVNSIHGRFKNMNVYLYHSAVQGEGAATELCQGIEFFNVYYPVDIIIIGRGGGSQEDLMIFNDEQLIREISDSQIPVITGIGHREDVCFADLVADVHEITPTAAGKRAVPNKSDLLLNLERLRNQINESYDKLIKIRNQQKHIETQKKKIVTQKEHIQTQKEEITEQRKELIQHKDIIKVERKTKRGYKIIIYLLLAILMIILGWFLL